LSLGSVITRVIAWDTAIKQAMAPPHPRFRSVLSAFGVGLFANAVLPGRIGELARVAVLTRRLPGRRGIWATLVGSVVAHRVFDIFPVIALIVWVLFAAKNPLWPGNVGLLQAAVAFPLVSYGVDYGVGFAYGIGLQAIEASVGIGIGFLFLAREGLSYAMLKSMPQPTDVDDGPVESEQREHAGAVVS